MAQHKIYEMSFSNVYPHYLAKGEKKGRSQDELHKIISWLTGYSESTLQEALDDQRSFKVFFETAPALNPPSTIDHGQHLWCTR